MVHLTVTFLLHWQNKNDIPFGSEFLIGLSVATMEGNEVLLTTSDVSSVQGIPLFLLRDIFLHFDVCTKFRLQR